MKPIVCKCRVLSECKSTRYGLRVYPIRVVRKQGCKLRANEPASYQVKSLLGCELT